MRRINLILGEPGPGPEEEYILVELFNWLQARWQDGWLRHVNSLLLGVF